MIKGINQDYTPDNTPEGYGFFAKNVVGQRKYDALLNEKGTVISASLSNLNILDFLGEIVFQSKLIIFYNNTNNSNCIAVVDEDTNTVVEKLNRTDLEFNKDFPISGRAKLNSRGELIVAFTDRNVTPKYINLDTASPADSKSIYNLFLTGNQPDYTLTVVDNGGNVIGGVYFATIRYIDKNKSATDWTVLSSPIYITTPRTLEPFRTKISTPSGVQTNKAIKIELSGLDTAFNKIELGFISGTGDVIKAFGVKQVDYTGTTLSIVYTGTEVTTLLNVEEVITKNFNFDRVDALTSLTDVLYVAGGYINPDVDLQEFTNTLYTKLRWKSIPVRAPFETNPADPATPFSSDGNKRTLMHGEVYALYARYYLDGKWTRYFHIPGREPTAFERGTGLGIGGLQSNFATDNPKIYKYDDTCTKISQVGTGINVEYATGALGAWENEDETYSQAFPQLAGAKVRHHKMPSMDFLKKLVYDGDSYYGIRRWDQLSLFLDPTTTIPTEYLGRITKIELAYAKRDEASTTVLGYDIPFLMGTRVGQTLTKLPTGGNWGVDRVTGGNNIISINDGRNLLRMHCPDIMINKPNITNIYLEQIVKTNCNPSVGQFNYSQNGFAGHEATAEEPYGRVYTNAPDTGIYIFLSNFLQYGAATHDYTPTGLGNPANDTLGHNRDKRFIKLLQTKYLQRGVRLDTDSGRLLDNLRGEEVLYGEIDTTVSGFYPVTTLFSRLLTGTLVANPPSTNLMEEVILTAIKSMRSNVFNSYLDQIVVPLKTGTVAVNGVVTLSAEDKGDAFICAHSFITLAPNTEESVSLDSTSGIKCMKVFLCESRFNLNQRYEEVGNYSTYFYPSGTVFNNNVISGYWQQYIVQASTPVNEIRLSKDFSQENTFEGVGVFNHNVDLEFLFPNIIIKSDPANRESGIEDGWRIFKPNNYFYTVKDRGRIVNLEGVANDSLLIHHESGLFRTRGNVVLEAGINEISLGKGDIFEIEPKEVGIASYGYGGTKHKFSCLLTEVGYFFADAERGEIFMYDFNKLDMITKGFRNELYDFLTTDPIIKASDNPYQRKGISTAFDPQNYRVLFSLSGSTAFTLSYDLVRKEWLGGHDYKPQRLFNTRKTLFAIDGNQLHKHNFGPRGNFYGIVYPSFVDVVINTSETTEKVLAAIRWITNVVKDKANKYNETITSVTVWNDKGCTGKIDLTSEAQSIYDIQSANLKNYDNTWQFDEIMDIVKDHNSPFIAGFIDDYRPILANLDNSLAWHELVKMRGKYFIVRLEYSNFEDKEVYLQKVIPEIRASY